MSQSSIYWNRGASDGGLVIPTQDGLPKSSYSCPLWLICSAGGKMNLPRLLGNFTRLYVIWFSGIQISDATLGSMRLSPFKAMKSETVLMLALRGSGKYDFGVRFL